MPPPAEKNLLRDKRDFGELLIASYSAIKTIYPEIENVQATEFGDFTDTSSLDFTNREGELLGDAEFAQIADEIAARFESFRKEGQEGRISPYGVSTIKRAAVVGSLVRRASDGTGAGIRPAASTLEGRLYQSAYLQRQGSYYKGDTNGDNPARLEELKGLWGRSPDKK